MTSTGVLDVLLCLFLSIIDSLQSAYLLTSNMDWPNEALRSGDDTLNYFGATIFWLYIVAALYFSAVVVYTVHAMPYPRVEEYNVQQRVLKEIGYFSGLAGASFGCLSVNMLNILIQSYQIWSDRHNLQPTLSATQIWRWSITSTLFQDFGEAIVEHPARYFWAHGALVGTLAVCVFMGVEGKRRPYPTFQSCN